MSDAFAYDVVDYPAHVYPQLHPSRLAAIARLHGVAAASPTACRFLEVGCGDGVQLLSLALAYPGSHFVGVDLSQAAIARGEAMRAGLGLDNARLVAADLTQWDPGEAPYDFILAHGFYSWVPAPVRERLLALCGSHLAASGVACISYNALPGSQLRRMLWEIMKFHADAAATPRERVESAVECLDLLTAGMPAGRNYTHAMAAEIAELRDRLDANVLFHDDLAQINEPFTLDQFVGRARQHGLAFVAEASYHEMSLRNATPDVRPLLQQVGQDDIVTKEQYLDFFTGRRFRQTLLCRGSARPRARADAAALAGLDVVTDMSPTTPADTDGAARSFSHPASGGLKTEDRSFQAMLDLCAERHPHPQPIEGLVDEACRRAFNRAATDDDRARLFDSLLRAFEVGLVELHRDAPRFARGIGDHPLASPLARWLVVHGRAEALIPSLRPRMVALEDPVMRALLPLLDGSRDRTSLLVALADEVARRAADTPQADMPESTPDAWRARLAPGLEGALSRVAGMALLMPGD